MFYQCSTETRSKAPFWSFGPDYLLSTRFHYHPKSQVVVSIPRRIPVPSSRPALDSLDQVASTSVESRFAHGWPCRISQKTRGQSPVFLTCCHSMNGAGSPESDRAALD
jgi:hypothetical protein